jgi:hypothetical protein
MLLNSNLLFYHRPQVHSAIRPGQAMHFPKEFPPSNVRNAFRLKNILLPQLSLVAIPHSPDLRRVSLRLTAPPWELGFALGRGAVPSFPNGL